MNLTATKTNENHSPFRDGAKAPSQGFCGSSTQISDHSANITHHIAYLPSDSYRDGENFFEMRDYWGTDYKFNAKELDSETGMYYYGARYYTPELSIWLSVDPLSDHPNQIDKSPYAAFWNNPIRYNDPDGRCPECPEPSKANNGDMYMSSGGGLYLYGEGEWTRQDGTLPATTITASRGNNVSNGNNAANSGVTPFDVGVEWLTGTGPRHRDFSNGDVFTEMLRQHEHILATKASIPGMIANGTMTGSAPYSLSGVQGVGKYVKDYSTLATGGLTGNLAVTYLGSYNLQWEVTAVNGNSATVQFLVNNSSTIQSATRPPVIGYYSWWQNSVGAWINSSFSSGPMSPTTQTFRWTETVTW